MKKWLDKTLIFICLILGLMIATWTFTVQSAFFLELGVSAWGAVTVEPLIIVISFLLGTTKLPTWNKILGSCLLILLTIVSLSSMISMYTKHSYTVIDSSKASIAQLSTSAKNEELIRNSLQGLSERGTTSSKSITKAIDQLQKQQEKTEQIVKHDTLELKAIIETIAAVMRTTEKNAIFWFALFVSLAAVFSPSFLFYSASKMITNVGWYDNVTDQFDRMKDLSLKQKIILLTKENVSGDVEEIAKFLKTTPTVVKSQLTRIDKKFKGEDVSDEDEGLKI